MSMRAGVVSALCLVAVTAAQPAAAVEASGHAVMVVRNTAASGPGGERALVTKGAVFAGDVIKTDRSGTAQIQFADNTRMVVGPNSQVTLDSFVFASSSQASAFAINAVRGSFRFITGVSAKNAYSIETPTATIGVRGTAFDGHVARDGTTTVIMWHGAVNICNKAAPRNCMVIAGACTVVQIDPEDRFNRVNNVYERTDLIDRSIPFAFRQRRLFNDFRVSSRGCEIRNFDPPPNTHSDSSSPAASPPPPPPSPPPPPPPTTIQ